MMIEVIDLITDMCILSIKYFKIQFKVFFNSKKISFIEMWPDMANK